jgi:outer membrane protein TolC
MKAAGKIFFIGTFLVGSFSFAQSMTFKEALAKAKDNNSGIRSLRLSHDSSEWQKTRAFATFMPKLSISGEHLMDQKFALMPVDLGGQPGEFPVESPYTQYDLHVTYTLFDGLGGLHQYQAASLQAQASSLELKRAEFQLEREIRSRFYQALGAQTLADVAGQRVKNLEEHLTTAKRYVQSGVSTSYDTLRIEVQLAEAKTEKLQADDNVTIAKNRLAVSIGQENIPEQLVGDFPNLDQVKIPDDLKVDARNRDDIQAKMLREQSAFKMSAASKSWWAPKINLYADKQFYNFADHDWSDAGKFKDAYFIGVNLNWEFFDGGAAYANQHIAANQAKIASEGTRNAVLQLPQEFDLWKRRYIYSVSVFKTNVVSISKAQEAVRQATIGKKAGTRTVNDVIDSQLELDISKSKMVQAQIDAMEALGNLELASGTALY